MFVVFTAKKQKKQNKKKLGFYVFCVILGPVC